MSLLLDRGPQRLYRDYLSMSTRNGTRDAKTASPSGKNMASSKLRLKPGQRKPKNTVKFMQVLDHEVWRQTEREAKARGVTGQEFIRAVVLPFYFRNLHAHLLDPQNYAALEQHLKEERKSRQRLAKLIK